MKIQETFKFWDMVRLVLEVLRYFYYISQRWFCSLMYSCLRPQFVDKQKKIIYRVYKDIVIVYVLKSFIHFIFSLRCFQPSSPVNQKSLVIGSNLIKHFEESKLSNHAICCNPSPHMKHIDQKLKSVTQSGVKYQSVTIVAGDKRRFVTIQ